MLNNYKSYMWNEFIIYNIPILNDKTKTHKIFYNTKNGIYTANKVIESKLYYHTEEKSFNNADDALAFINE